MRPRFKSSRQILFAAFINHFFVYLVITKILGPPNFVIINMREHYSLICNLFWMKDTSQGSFIYILSKSKSSLYYHNHGCIYLFISLYTSVVVFFLRGGDPLSFLTKLS